MQIWVMLPENSEYKDLQKLHLRYAHIGLQHFEKAPYI